MPTLLIEHEVPNYDGWKKAFDSDPIDTKKLGVKDRKSERPGLIKTNTVRHEIDYSTSLFVQFFYCCGATRHEEQSYIRSYPLR